MLVVKGLAVCLLTTTLPVRFQVFLLSNSLLRHRTWGACAACIGLLLLEGLCGKGSLAWVILLGGFDGGRGRRN